jgi:hypothetical protein
VRRADNLTTFIVPNVLKSGNLKLLEPSGPVQACNELRKDVEDQVVAEVPLLGVIY